MNLPVHVLWESARVHSGVSITIYSHPCFVLVGTHTCFTTRDMTDMSS